MCVTPWLSGLLVSASRGLSITRLLLRFRELNDVVVLTFDWRHYADAGSPQALAFEGEFADFDFGRAKLALHAAPRAGSRWRSKRVILVMWPSRSRVAMTSTQGSPLSGRALRWGNSPG